MLIRKFKFIKLGILLNIIYLLYLTIIINPLKENYSMLTNNIKGYFLILLLCLFLFMNMYISTFFINKKYRYITYFILLGGLFPYYKETSNIFNYLHEIFAYISFISINIITIINIFKFRLKYNKVGQYFAYSYFIVLSIDVILFINTNGVVAIEQFILLFTILIINYLMLKVTKGETNEGF